jgi:hypothetical protein
MAPSHGVVILGLAAGLAGCARPATLDTHARAAAPVAPAGSAVSAAPLPPPDDALRRWQAILADQARPPAGTTAAALLPELEAYLASPDPARRDAVAIDVLDAWIVQDKRLSPDDLRPLAERLIANLATPLDRRDGVFLRSFSALVLSMIAQRDLTEPIFDAAARRRLLEAARTYAQHETDLRGYTVERGWAHAAAHTADLLGQLARHPALTADDRGSILDAVAGFVVRRHGALLCYGEDGRLAQPVLAAARAGLAANRVDAWLAAIAAPLRERMGHAFDAGVYAANRNARNLLFTLFVQLTLDPSPTDGTRALLARVTQVLRG